MSRNYNIYQLQMQAHRHCLVEALQSPDLMRPERLQVPPVLSLSPCEHHFLLGSQRTSSICLYTRGQEFLQRGAK